MCIFTGTATTLSHVSATSIFARAVPGGRQVLVYSMSVAASEPVAMVLPVPVPPAPGDDALRFINLERYPRFFADLDRAFPPTFAVSGSYGMPEASAAPATLKVHQVGAFVASFVPSRADFARLDERFRLSDAVWAALPQYADWGFAVFQLKDVADPSGWLDKLKKKVPEPKTIHPMAFEFPLRDPSRIFFPTVHVHDGQVHEQASFDHSLYAQPLASHIILKPSWSPSLGPLTKYVDQALADDVVDGQLHAFKTTRSGLLPNQDTYVSTQPGELPPTLGTL
jgi:hypothetical protein